MAGLPSTKYTQLRFFWQPLSVRSRFSIRARRSLNLENLLTSSAAGFGMTWVFVTSTAFLTECVPKSTAGVVALGNLLRNPAAAIAAVVIEPLISRMGLGWCFTGLALLDVFYVGSAVLILRVKSPAWRKKRDADQAATAAKIEKSSNV